jgi:hypothetical protein
MTLYRVRARRHTHPRLGSEGISRAAIEWLISDALLARVEEIDSLHVDVALHLDREDHLEAANEVIEALQRLGYSVVNLEVDELVSHTAETAFLSALGIGGTAHAKTKNPLLALIAAIGAACVGHWVASQMEHFETTYRFTRSMSGWQLVPVGPA